MAKRKSHPLSKKKPRSAYMSRNQALRKLQLSLKDFRRLCILKGIFPRNPKKKVRDGGSRTYYYTKDILYLAHEPLIAKFREFKTFLKKYAKAIGTKDHALRNRLKKHRPIYRLDHIIKERYPTFDDALGDLDDTLCLVHLFSMLPQTNKIPSHRTRNCHRLVTEFHYWLVQTKSLRKVFVSIKGIYYQASILGKDVNWLVPHKFTQQLPADVDFAIMLTFLEFYEVLLHFVNLRLYRMSELYYPPKFNKAMSAAGDGLSSIVLSNENAILSSELKPVQKKKNKSKKVDNQRIESLKADLASIATRDAENAQDVDLTEDPQIEAEIDAYDDEVFGASNAGKVEIDQTKLFENLVFYLPTEVPREPLELVIRCAGGTITWGGEHAPIPYLSDKITHEIVDRPGGQYTIQSRSYCQPQWIFDSFNSKCLLPIEQYAPGVPLPPHLSPFASGSNEIYTPERARELERIIAASQGEVVPEGEEKEDSDDDSEDDSEDDESAPSKRQKVAEDKKVAKKPIKAIQKDSDDEDEDSDEEAWRTGIIKDKHEIGPGIAGSAHKNQKKANLSKEEQDYLAELEAEKKGVTFADHVVKKAKEEKKRLKAESQQRPQKRSKEDEEQRQLALAMMSRKHRKLYSKITTTQTKKEKKKIKLEQRAKDLSKSSKKSAQ